MTNPDENRAAAADKLARLALDLSDTPAEAVTILMRAGAHILDVTLGADAAAQVMHEATGEALRAWQASRSTASGATH